VRKGVWGSGGKQYRCSERGGELRLKGFWGGGVHPSGKEGWMEASLRKAWRRNGFMRQNKGGLYAFDDKKSKKNRISVAPAILGGWFAGKELRSFHLFH